MAKVPRDVRRRSANPEGRMAVMDHLRELRRRMIIMVVIVAVGAVVGWLFYPDLLSFLKHPYCNVPQQYRYTNGGRSCDLV